MGEQDGYPVPLVHSARCLWPFTLAVLLLQAGPRAPSPEVGLRHPKGSSLVVGKCDRPPKTRDLVVGRRVARLYVRYGRGTAGSGNICSSLS